MKFYFVAMSAVFATSCATTTPTLYDSAPATEVALFKHMPIPLPKGTKTTVRQGAFGASSHNESGNQYSWDFEVPFDTPVIAAERGAVVDVWLPPGFSSLSLSCSPDLKLGAETDIMGQSEYQLLSGVNSNS